MKRTWHIAYRDYIKRYYATDTVSARDRNGNETYVVDSEKVMLTDIIDRLHKEAEDAENSEVRKGILIAIDVIKGEADDTEIRTEDNSDSIE